MVLAPRIDGVVALADSGSHGEVFEHASWIMGQIARIWIQGGEEERAHQAINAAFAAMRDLEGSLSSFRADSELSDFLAVGTGRPHLVSPSFARAFESARSAWIETRGAFDPSVVRDRPAPGMEAFVLDGSRLRRSSREAVLDFGGIGCGLALDEAAAVLRAHGVRRALLEMSGDFLALDAPAGFPGWPLAAADPWTGEPTEVEFDLVHGALATSAVVDRHEILDPRTGRGATHAFQATILASSATSADAWSTAAVVGPLVPSVEAFALYDRGGRLLRG